MTTILITGATRGLGLATAHAAAARSTVLVAGHDHTATEQAAAAVGAQPISMDLASLRACRKAVRELPDIDTVVCNAGVQAPGDQCTTADGFEETFQVNFLAHVALVDALLAFERPPSRVVWVGSSTHDPKQRTGMPAPREDDIEAIARGDMGIDERAGHRRYTTSKLLTTAVTAAYARERPDLHVSCLDPGLMTTAGLARRSSGRGPQIAAALGGVIALMPFASTPARSGAQLAALAVDNPPPTASGSTIDHRGRPARISARARDTAFQDELLRVARHLLDHANAPAEAQRHGAAQS